MKAALEVSRPRILKLFTDDPFFKRFQEIHDAIAKRAFELFERNGGLVGRELEDWFQAESEFLHKIPLELTETEDEFAITAEVPGFTEQDVEVRVEPRRIYISGKREEKKEQKKGETRYSEQRANEIFRSFDLPADIDPDDVTATLKDGLLKVVLPKARKAKKVLVSASAA